MAKNYIKWRSRSITAQGQRLYRSTSEFNFDDLPPPIATLPIDTEEYTDSDVLVGITYYYMISSFDRDVEKFSDPVSIDTSLPILGPGSDTLIGNNDTCGFFGEVPVDELINGDDLANLLGLTSGASKNPTDPWLKFLIDNKIYFVAKKTYRHSISWDHINEVNAINGSRIIQIGGYAYRIGLLKGLGPDVSDFSSGYDTPATHGSEWNRLMYNVSADASNELYQKKYQLGDNWVEYPVDDLGYIDSGRLSWCQETSPINSSSKIVRAGSGGAVAYMSTQATTATNSCGWRPRLELVVN